MVKHFARAQEYNKYEAMVIRQQPRIEPKTLQLIAPKKFSYDPVGSHFNPTVGRSEGKLLFMFNSKGKHCVTLHWAFFQFPLLLLRVFFLRLLHGGLPIWKFNYFCLKERTL